MAVIATPNEGPVHSGPSPLYAAPSSEKTPTVSPAPAIAPQVVPLPQPDGSLSLNDAQAVQTTLLKVSALIQRFAEGRSERTTPVQAVRRSLNMVLADAHAKYASVSILSENMDTSLLIAAVGVQDSVHEANRLHRFPNSGSSVESLVSTGADYMTWSHPSPTAPPTDWAHLHSAAGLQHISAVPIRVADRVAGVLTLGFEDTSGQQADKVLFPTYMQLISASLSAMVKDNSIPKYMVLVKELHDCTDIDTLMHKVAQHLRVVLGHTSNHHVWYRIGLTAPNNAAATIFDDLTQVPAPLMQRTLSNPSGSSSYKLLKEVQASGGVMRTVVAMKNTVMKIAVHNRQQVMIPDVQKVINQSGNVSADIFNTRLIKPPTSVLVFPLKVKQHIFGVIFCMSSVQTDFADVSPRLRETCEVMAPHLLQLMTVPMGQEYKAMQSNSVVNTSMAASVDSLPGRLNGSIGRSDSLGVSLSGDSFAYNQSRSSTGALVTGLTEKLNQKRIRSSMDFNMTSSMVDLQITSLLGEGGFAKVFRGLWRGLVVGVKVVCDDGKNEKMVMKNAHEIAILSALSHPNIMQAYNCLTDVQVHDFVASCMRFTSPAVLSSPAFKYLMSMEEKTCHIEVIEYCDLGNLSTALKNSIFFHSAERQNGDASGEVALTGAGARPTQKLHAQVHMRTLLLTLIEVASAMSYLHKMGVVHCDLKPANVLLKSSNMDSRGFTAKVSDFGLSRVEDDDTCASFPFNSCGTAAYVAPEALICNKKVNSSVDVYAFGILSWEMYTSQRPYGNMKQQQLVEEVVMRGLRPKFPSAAPSAYVMLAQSCWSGSPAARPSFDEVLSTLNNMLQTIEERDTDCGNYAAMYKSGQALAYDVPPGAGGAADLLAANSPATPSSPTAAAAAALQAVNGVGGGAGVLDARRRASNLGPGGAVPAGAAGPVPRSGRLPAPASPHSPSGTPGPATGGLPASPAGSDPIAPHTPADAQAANP